MTPDIPKALAEVLLERMVNKCRARQAQKKSAWREVELSGATSMSPLTDLETGSMSKIEGTLPDMQRTFPVVSFLRIYFFSGTQVVRALS